MPSGVLTGRLGRRRREAGLALPDGRAWELVSPADKRGAVIVPIVEAGLDQAAGDGAAFTFLTSLPTEAEPQGYGDLVQVLARRNGGGGWSSEDLGLPRSAPVGVFAGKGHEYRFFSEELSTAVAEPFGAFSPPKSGEASPPASGRTPYVRNDQAGFLGGRLEPLVTGCPPLGQLCPPELQEGADVPPGTEFNGEESAAGNATFVGATPDAEHVVLSSSVQLTQAAAPFGGLYEWSALAPASDRLRLVSVLPEGAGVAPTPVLAGAGAGNAVSSDGSRVFYATAAGHLYMRDVPGEATELLDAPETGSVPANGGAQFQAANAGGTEVFFTDRERLVAEAGLSGHHRSVCV